VRRAGTNGDRGGAGDCAGRFYFIMLFFVFRIDILAFTLQDIAFLNPTLALALTDPAPPPPPRYYTSARLIDFLAGFKVEAFDIDGDTILHLG